MISLLVQRSSGQSIRFEDASETAGIKTAGGSYGVAVNDFDRDGWDDIYIAADEGRSVLFHNQGDGTFADVTETAGVSVPGSAVNPIWGDVDNDGLADLFVGTRGSDTANKLFLNAGEGRFVEIGTQSGLNLDLSIGSAAFGDFDNDGRLDLFLATREAYDVLYRNTGNPDSFFEDVSGISGTGGQDYSIAMEATWNDYDLDGDLDLFTVHDGNLQSRFYRQQQGFPMFTNVSAISGLQVARSSMGVSWGDYNNDGWPDVYVTNIDEGNLFMNVGDGTFQDVTYQTKTGLNGMSWGVVFADFDNDGDEDLFIGNTFDFDGRRSFLYENRAGEFINVAEQAGAALSTNTFGVATGDFNRDGRVDLIVADEGGENKLLINVTEPDGNWIALDLKGQRANAMAVGVRVRLVTGRQSYYRTVSGGASYCSQISATLHAGLGESIKVDTLVVFWRPGVEQIFTALDVNKRYTLVEGSTINVGSERIAAYKSSLSLAQNYPNPFSVTTKIPFSLEKSQLVLLKVYDMLGKEKQVLANRIFEAGRHVVEFVPYGWPAGVYFYELQSVEGIQVRKMILVDQSSPISR